jgi:hypothetical protein
MYLFLLGTYFVLAIPAMIAMLNVNNGMSAYFKFKKIANYYFWATFEYLQAVMILPILGTHVLTESGYYYENLEWSLMSFDFWIFSTGLDKK